MKCPNCGDPHLAYSENRSKMSKPEKMAAFRKMEQTGAQVELRTDYSAKCKKCGWSGEVRT